MRLVAAIYSCPRSFEWRPFYRGKDNRYAVQGTGMGLAIAKAVIEAHGGTIGVTSQTGQGSVFWFSLPATPKG